MVLQKKLPCEVLFFFELHLLCNFFVFFDLNIQFCLQLLLLFGILRIKLRPGAFLKSRPAFSRRCSIKSITQGQSHVGTRGSWDRPRVNGYLGSGVRVTDVRDWWSIEGARFSRDIGGETSWLHKLPGDGLGLLRDDMGRIGAASCVEW